MPETQKNRSITLSAYQRFRCKECDDLVHSLSNFCPRCMIPIFHAPNITEDIYEIDDPVSAECLILKPRINNTLIVSTPYKYSRRLFLMTSKDLVLLLDEEDSFYKVRTFGSVEGYLLKEVAIKVNVGIDDVDENQALGFFRVNEYLIRWKSSKLSYEIKDAPIKTEPHFNAPEVARITSDVILPVVGETYGWFEIQLPSFFRGWIPEAYGYRMLTPNSMPEIERPKTAGEILAGVVGVVGAVTLIGVGAAIGAIADDF